jgi:hypothetical protein
MTGKPGAVGTSMVVPFVFGVFGWTLLFSTCSIILSSSI